MKWKRISPASEHTNSTSVDVTLHFWPQSSLTKRGPSSENWFSACPCDPKIDGLKVLRQGCISIGRHDHQTHFSLWDPFCLFEIPIPVSPKPPPPSPPAHAHTDPLFFLKGHSGYTREARWRLKTILVLKKNVHYGTRYNTVEVSLIISEGVIRSATAWTPCPSKNRDTIIMLFMHSGKSFLILPENFHFLFDLYKQICYLASCKTWQHYNHYFRKSKIRLGKCIYK